MYYDSCMPKDKMFDVMEEKYDILFDIAATLEIIPGFHKTLKSATTELLPLFKKIEDFRKKEGMTRQQIVWAINYIANDDLIFDDEIEGQYGYSRY